MATVSATARRAVLAMLILSCGLTFSATACAPGFDETPSGCYMVVSETKTRAPAIEHCEGLDPPAKLIDLETKQEFDDVIVWLSSGKLTRLLKHLYNIYTTSAQRLRRWTNNVLKLCKCFGFTGYSRFGLSCLSLKI